MQSFELNLNELADDFDGLLKKLPDMRRELHEELAKQLETQLYYQISGSFSNPDGVMDMQGSHVGSKGGYAAIRANKGLGPHGYSDSPGALTNYLENGHRIRPRGTGKNYRPRIKVSGAYVSGRHFYSNTEKVIESAAIQTVEAFRDRLADALEGKK